MTELELMQHAQNYINSLANGINPLDNSQLPDSDIVNNVRISRCLFYVSGVLQKVIDNDGKIVNTKNKLKKLPFTITDEQLKNIQISKYPISLSEIVENVNQTIDLNIYKKLTYSKVADWLITQGLLETQTVNGKSKKVITEKSNSIGMSLINKHGQYGIYTVIVYNTDAQQFVVSSLPEIIYFINNQD